MGALDISPPSSSNSEDTSPYNAGDYNRNPLPFARQPVGESNHETMKGNMVVAPSSSPSVPSHLGNFRDPPMVLLGSPALHMPQLQKTEQGVAGDDPLQLKISPDTPSERHRYLIYDVSPVKQPLHNPPISSSTKEDAVLCTMMRDSDGSEDGEEEEGDQGIQPLEESGSASQCDHPSPPAIENRPSLEPPKGQMVVGLGRRMAPQDTQLGSLTLATDTKKVITETHSEPPSQAAGDTKQLEQASPNGSETRSQPSYVEPLKENLVMQNRSKVCVVMTSESPVLQQPESTGGCTDKLLSAGNEPSHAAVPVPNHTLSQSSVYKTADQPSLTSFASSPQTPPPREPDDAHMVPAIQRQLSTVGEAVMPGENFQRRSEVITERHCGDGENSVMQSMSTTGSRVQDSEEVFDETKLNVHAMEHVCNGKMTDCIFMVRILTCIF